MVDVCFYFQVHQPLRLKRYNIFEIGSDNSYFDEKKNREIMQKVARKCYLPMNNLLLKLIEKHKPHFKIAFSLSGVVIEQMQEYAPEVLEGFKKLAATGKVEFLSETYYHSLSYLYSKEEFKEQVELHRQVIRQLFNQEPKVFRNTELIFNNELANFVQGMGFRGILAEGADHVLGWRSPNYTYTARTAPDIKVLLKNYKLSDDIAFRFGNKGWKEYPLTASKYAAWIAENDGHSVNLFMDYETFGEHQWEDTGIFDFMEHLPEELLKYKHVQFAQPSKLATYEPRAELDIHNFVSWADVERDLSAWLGNQLQESAIKELYVLEPLIKKTGSADLLQKWRKLTTSDHFYYMCTKWFNDGDVHKYFNPYESPYEAFIAFMNVLNDLVLKTKEAIPKKNIYTLPSELVKERGE